MFSTNVDSFFVSHGPAGLPGEVHSLVAEGDARAVVLNSTEMFLQGPGDVRFDHLGDKLIQDVVLDIEK